MATYTLKGKNARIERDALRAMSLAFGVKPTVVGQVIVLKGRTFTVDGVNPDFATRPFIVKRDDGKRFPIRVETLRAAIPAAFIARRDRALRAEIGVSGVPGF